MVSMVWLYLAVLEAVGSRAPWREIICTKVIWHWGGTSVEISEGTLKKGEY